MNIYVGNLSYEVSETELQSIFGDFGEVTSVKIINDMQTGRSKGFGFVEMASAADAEKAIAELNGTQLKGRPLTVNEARPRPERGPRTGNGGGGGGFRGDRGGRDRR